ncbi:MAG: GGDEF domain-containing protein, partial [Desulfuromonadales bacterium]|nr:GGDEF domain-containing protein [Desulfuromonadales bacterium]NIR33723.1 GGDEF domain-containing protein [Desulfuromonadales bacterium]NIS42397.1 GGDEF domain-containing protein [Desulfuromonadales bacterium]
MEGAADNLFAKDAEDEHLLVTRIEETANRQGDAAYRQALQMLVGTDFDDETSRRHWQGAMEHWRGFKQGSEAGPGLRAALFDYLYRVAGIMENPLIVEAEYLDNLRQSSITDGLTGLYNQTHFKLCLSRLLDRVRHQGASGGAVLLLDLDRFKQYNDRCGHLAGDKALRQAGQLITKNLRQCDLACRYGGEEFIILLPGVDQAKALTVAERIR